MAVSARVEAIDRDVALLLRDTMGPQAQSKYFAEYARGQLKEGERVNQTVFGRIIPHKTFVDGVAGANEDQVRPSGTIHYEFDLIADLFKWIEEQLIKHSPVRSGRYSKSFAFYADGAEIDVGSTIPPGASEFVFLNTQPYSRKIEPSSGWGSKHGALSSQAPEGVFEAVAALARRRFGNQAKINFTYRAPLSGAIHDWASKTTGANFETKAAKRRIHDVEWLTSVPSIVITLK